MININPIAWVLKIISGVLLFIFVGIHLLSIHSTLIPTHIDVTVRWVTVALLTVHIITAVRDILVESRVRGYINYVVLVAIALVLVLSPLLSPKSLSQFVPENFSENRSCVKDPTWMLYHHSSLLKEWRTKFVREGIIHENGYEFTLRTCFSCHSYESFCLQCHSRISLQPNCYSCHYNELPTVK